MLRMEIINVHMHRQDRCTDPRVFTSKILENINSFLLVMLSDSYFYAVSVLLVGKHYYVDVVSMCMHMHIHYDRRKLEA